jgi:hypothetical protein
MHEDPPDAPARRLLCAMRYHNIPQHQHQDVRYTRQALNFRPRLGLYAIGTAAAAEWACVPSDQPV